MQKKTCAACKWHSQLDDSIGTLLRLCLSGFGKIFAKQRLLLAFVRIHGPFSRPKNPSKTCARNEYVASINCYTLEFSGCMLLKKWSLRVQIVRSKNELESRLHQNAGSKMRPLSEPSGNMPILRGTKNGSKFRAHF